MDADQARARLLAERAEVADLLADTESAAQQDRETEDEEATVYVSDAAQPLTEEGIDDAVLSVLSERERATSTARPLYRSTALPRQFTCMTRTTTRPRLTALAPQLLVDDLTRLRGVSFAHQDTDSAHRQNIR